jgi:hypothetical protein
MRKPATSLRKHPAPDHGRVRIVITDAERRNARIQAAVHDIWQRVTALVPRPVQDPAVQHLKAVLTTPASRLNDMDRDATPSLQDLRGSLYAPVQTTSTPAVDGQSMQLQLAIHTMHLVLVLTVLPVGLLMAAISVVAGNDLRRTAQVMTITGLVMTSMLSNTAGILG